MVGTIVLFTMKMWKFGIKKRDLNNVAKELKSSVARKKERLCAERIDNFADTSYTHSGQGGSRVIATTGGDGLAAGTASHTREDGGSNMNNLVYDGTTYNLPFFCCNTNKAFAETGNRYATGFKTKVIRTAKHFTHRVRHWQKRSESIGTPAGRL